MFYIRTCWTIFCFQNNFPRTLEALVLHVLSPVGAEVLTRKFDEMDEQALEGDRYFLICTNSISVSRGFKKITPVIVAAFLITGINSMRFSTVHLMTSLQQ